MPQHAALVARRERLRVASGSAGVRSCTELAGLTGRCRCRSSSGDVAVAAFVVGLDSAAGQIDRELYTPNAPRRRGINHP